jgi:hypothetical protein
MGRLLPRFPANYPASARRNGEEAHCELLTVDAVVDPVTGGRNPFSGGDRGRMADGRGPVAMPARLHG